LCSFSYPSFCFHLSAPRGTFRPRFSLIPTLLLHRLWLSYLRPIVCGSVFVLLQGRSIFPVFIFRLGFLRSDFGLAGFFFLMDFGCPRPMGGSSWPLGSTLFTCFWYSHTIFLPFPPFSASSLASNTGARVLFSVPLRFHLDSFLLTTCFTFFPPPLIFLHHNWRHDSSCSRPPPPFSYLVGEPVTPSPFFPQAVFFFSLRSSAKPQHARVFVGHLAATSFGESFANFFLNVYCLAYRPWIFWRVRVVFTPSTLCLPGIVHCFFFLCF